MPTKSSADFEKEMEWLLKNKFVTERGRMAAVSLPKDLMERGEVEHLKFTDVSSAGSIISFYLDNGMKKEAVDTMVFETLKRVIADHLDQKPGFFSPRNPIHTPIIKSLLKKLEHPDPTTRTELIKTLESGILNPDQSINKNVKLDGNYANFCRAVIYKTKDLGWAFSSQFTEALQQDPTKEKHYIVTL